MDGSAWGLLLAGAAGALSVALAGLLGVLRPSALGRDPRVPPGRPLAPLVGVLFAGLVVWLVAPSLYFNPGPASPGQPVAPEAPAAPAPPRFSARELVAVNAVVPVLAFLVLAAGNALVRPRVGQRLGFGARRAPRGVAWGAAGILLALPLVYCVMAVTEWLYRVTGYQHPEAHDLLKTMGETPDPVVKYLAIAVAVVVAPLWEELLFRGHVQTLIREGLIRLREGGAPAGNWPGFSAAGTVAATGGLVPPLAQVAGAGRAFPFETWLAIVMASLVFASVHQPWQFPPIFALSLCLGLAYERTGNLWAPVVMHSLFNTLMTVYFLLRGTGAD